MYGSPRCNAMGEVRGGRGLPQLRGNAGGPAAGSDLLDNTAAECDAAHCVWRKDDMDVLPGMTGRASD